MNSFSNSDQNDFDRLAASNARISNGINNIHGDLSETNSLIKSGFNTQAGILSSVKNGISSVGRGISNVYNNNKEEYGINTQEFSRRFAAMAGGPIGVAVRDILSNSGINVGNIVKKSIGGISNIFHGHNNKLDNDINDLESINNRQLSTNNQQLAEIKKANQLLNNISKKLDDNTNTTALNNKSTRLESNAKSKLSKNNELVDNGVFRNNKTQLNNTLLRSARNSETGASSSPSEVVDLLRQIAESQQGLRNYFNDPNAAKEGGVFGTLVKDLISMPFGFKYWFNGRYSKDIHRGSNPLETIVNALIKMYEWERIGIDLSRRQLNQLIMLQGGTPQKYIGHESGAMKAIKRVGSAIKEGATKTLGNNAIGRGVGSLLSIPISLMKFGDEDFQDEQYSKAYRVFSGIGKSQRKGIKGFFDNITGGDKELNKLLYSEKNIRDFGDTVMGSDVDNSEIPKILKNFKTQKRKENDEKFEKLKVDATVHAYFKTLKEIQDDAETSVDSLNDFLKRTTAALNSAISQYGLDGIHGKLAEINPVFKRKYESIGEFKESIGKVNTDNIFIYEDKDQRKKKVEKYREYLEKLLNNKPLTREKKHTVFQNLLEVLKNDEDASYLLDDDLEEKFKNNENFKNGGVTTEAVNYTSKSGQHGQIGEAGSEAIIPLDGEVLNLVGSKIADVILHTTSTGTSSTQRTSNSIVPVVVINPNKKIVSSLRRTVGGGFLPKESFDDIYKNALGIDTKLSIADQIANSLGDKISIDKLIKAIKENKSNDTKTIADNIKDLTNTLDPEKSSSKKDGTKNHQEIIEENIEKSANLLELILKGQSKQKITVDVDKKESGGLLNMLGSMGQSIGSGLLSTLLKHPILATLIAAGVYGGLKDFFGGGKGGGFTGGVWNFLKGLSSYTFDNWHNFNQTSSTLSLINRGRKGVFERINGEQVDPYTREVRPGETVTKGEALQERVDRAVGKRVAAEARQISAFEEMTTAKTNLNEANRQVRSKEIKLRRLRHELDIETNQATRLEIQKDIKTTEAQLKQARKAARASQKSYTQSSKRFNKFNSKYNSAVDKTDKLIEELNRLPPEKARQLARGAIFRTATGKLVRATRTAIGWTLKPIAGLAAIQNTATIIYDIKTGEWSSAASNFRNFSYYSKHVGGTGMLVGVLDLVAHSAIERTRSKETVNVKFGDRQIELGTDASDVHQDVTRISQGAVNASHIYKLANASKKIKALNDARRAARAAEAAKGAMTAGKGAAGVGATTTAISTSAKVAGAGFAAVGGVVSGYEAWKRFEAGEITQGCCQTVCAGLHIAAGCCAMSTAGLPVAAILEACAIICDLATYVFDQAELNTAADAIIALKESNLNFLYMEDKNVQSFLNQICKDIDSGKFNKKDGSIDRNKLLIALAENYTIWKKKNGDVTTIIYKIMESDKKFHKDCYKAINAIKRELIVGSKKLDLEKSYEYNYKCSLLVLYKNTYLVAASKTVDTNKIINESNTNSSKYKYRNQYIDTSLESDLKSIDNSVQDKDNKENDEAIKNLLKANRIKLHKEILDRETEKSAIDMSKGRHGRRDKTGFETLRKMFGTIDTDRLSKVNDNSSVSAALDVASTPYQFLKHESGLLDGTDNVGMLQDITAVRDDEYNDETYDPEKFLGIIVTKHKHMAERKFGYSMNFEKFKDNGGLTFDNWKRDFAAYIRLALDDKDFESDTKDSYIKKWCNGVRPEYPVVYHISDFDSYIKLLRNIAITYRFCNEPIDYKKWDNYNPQYEQNFIQRAEGTKLYEKLSKCKGFNEYFGKCTTWGEFAEKCIQNKCNGIDSLETFRDGFLNKEFVRRIVSDEDGELEKQRISDGQKLVTEYINWYYSIGHKILAEDSKFSDTKEVVAQKIADIKTNVEQAKKDLELAEQEHKNGTLQMSEDEYKLWKEGKKEYIEKSSERIAEVEKNTYSYNAFKAKRDLQLHGVSGVNSGIKEKNRKQILKQVIERAAKDNRKKFGVLYKAIKNNSKEISEDKLNEKLAEFLKITGYFDNGLDDFTKIIIEEMISNPDYLDELVNILLNTPENEIEDKLSELYNDVINNIQQNGLYDAKLDPASEEYDENLAANEATKSYAYGNTDINADSVFEDSDSIVGFFDDGTPIIINRKDKILLKERISGITKSGIPFEIGEKGPEVISNGVIIPVGDNPEAKIAQDRVNRVESDLLNFNDGIHLFEGSDPKKQAKEIASNNQTDTESNTTYQGFVENSLAKANETLDSLKNVTKKGFDKAGDYFKDVKKFLSESDILGSLTNGFEKATEYFKDLANNFFEDEEFKSQQVNKLQPDIESKKDDENVKQLLKDAGLSNIDEFKALDVNEKYEILKKSKSYGSKINKELERKWSDLTVDPDLTAESANILAAKDVLSEEKGNIARSITAEQLSDLKDKKFEDLSDEEKIFEKFKKTEQYNKTKVKPTKYSEINTEDLVAAFGLNAKKEEKVREMDAAAKRNKAYAVSKKEGTFDAAVRDILENGFLINDVRHRYSAEQLAGDFSEEGRKSAYMRTEEKIHAAQIKAAEKAQLEKEKKEAEANHEIAINGGFSEGKGMPENIEELKNATVADKASNIEIPESNTPKITPEQAAEQERQQLQGMELAEAVYAGKMNSSEPSTPVQAAAQVAADNISNNKPANIKIYEEIEKNISKYITDDHITSKKFGSDEYNKYVTSLIEKYGITNEDEIEHIEEQAKSIWSSALINQRKNKTTDNLRIWSKMDFEDDEFKKDLAFAELNGIKLGSYNRNLFGVQETTLSDDGKMSFTDKLNGFQTENLNELRKRRLQYEKENDIKKSSSQYDLEAKQHSYDNIRNKLAQKLKDNNTSYDSWKANSLAKISELIEKRNAEITDHNNTFKFSQEELVKATPEEIFNRLGEFGYNPLGISTELSSIEWEKRDKKRYSDNVDDLLNTSDEMSTWNVFGMGSVSDFKEAKRKLDKANLNHNKESNLSDPVLLTKYMEDHNINNIYDLMQNESIPQRIKAEYQKSFEEVLKKKQEDETLSSMAMEEKALKEAVQMNSVETTSEKVKEITKESNAQTPVQTKSSSPVQAAKAVAKSDNVIDKFKSDFVKKYPWIDRDELNDDAIKEYSTRLAKEPWLATVDFVNDADDEMDAAKQWDMSKKDYELRQASGQKTGKVEGTLVGGQVSEVKLSPTIKPIQTQIPTETGVQNATKQTSPNEEKIEPVVTKAQEVKKYSKSLDKLSRKDRMKADDALMWAESNGRTIASDYMAIGVDEWNKNNRDIGSGEYFDHVGKWYSELSPKDRQKFYNQLVEYQTFGKKWNVEHQNDEDKPLNLQQAFINHEISQVKKSEKYSILQEKIHELLNKDSNLFNELDVYNDEDNRISDFWKNRENLDTEMWDMFGADDPYKRRAIVQIIGEAILDKENNSKYKRWFKLNENQTQQIIDNIQKTKEQDIKQNQENYIDVNKAKISNITSTNYQLDAEAGKLGTEQIVDGLKENANQIENSNMTAAYRVSKACSTSSTVNNIYNLDAERYYKMAEGSPAQIRA